MLSIRLVVAICVFMMTLSMIRSDDSSNSISFLAIGDWGGLPTTPYHTEAQVDVSQGMDKVAASIGSKFVAALGDNFYFDGVTTLDSNRFDDTWNNVYTGSNLQTPWYVIAGNHDHNGNVSVQIEYSQISNRWKFPNPYHSHQFTSSDGSVTVDIVMIDTIDLAGSFSYPEGHPNYFDKLPLKERKLAETQWTWIEQQMKESTADYLLVMGHYPVYSVCKHGNTDTLIAELLPLLEKYGAHYLSGHDHCMEHIKDSASSVQHYLIGMGVECCYSSYNKHTVPKDSLQWYMALDNRNHVKGGFASFTLTKSSMTPIFYDEAGNVIYTAPSVSPRK